RATTSTTSYSLSLHDALPIFLSGLFDGVSQSVTDAFLTGLQDAVQDTAAWKALTDAIQQAILTGAAINPALFSSVIDAALPLAQDRKSTRLNSSHVKISYAVF